MSDRTFQIELRQADVPFANARHYFWALTEVLNKGSKDEKHIVIQELHGWHSNPKTGVAERYNPLRHQLLLAHKFNEQTNYYDNSTKLPYVVAAKGTEEQVRKSWAAGQQMADFVNKKRIDYHLLGDNSNSMVKTVGRAMGFEVEPILDPRVGNPYERPMPVSLSTDLAMRFADAPISAFAQNLKTVGGYDVKVSPKDAWDESTAITEFADPFRPTMPR
jgi:hypothetical protein